MYKDEIQIYIGGPEKEKRPIMTRDHFAIFWLWALRELGLKPNVVYKGRDVHYIVFRNAELNELLKALVPALPTLYELRDALAEFADAFRVVTNEVIKAKYGVDWAYDVKTENFFKKLNKIIAMVEAYLRKNIAIEKGRLDTNGSYPKTVIRFKLDREVVAHIHTYWTGNKLLARFKGSRENVKRLASIIRALSGEVGIKTMNTGRNVKLTTDGIIAIRHDGWLKAVRGFVDELYSKKLIDEKRYEKLVRDIEAGPNTVKFAGVEFSVNYTNKGIQVDCHWSSEASKNAAVSALKAKGLEGGKHFTVREYGGYEIRITEEAYAKALEALTQGRLKEREHYTVDGKRHVIRVKEEHKDAVVNALKARGLEEGRDFTVESNKIYAIHITYDGLREIQRMALKGDIEAERFIRELKDVLSRRHGQSAVNKLITIITPAREEGVIDLPLPVHDDRSNLIAHVVDLRYEFVKGDQPVSQCIGKDCRLRIIVEYEMQGEKRELKIEWHWIKKEKKKGETVITYYYTMAWLTVKDDVEAAVLKALTGKEAKRRQVYLLANELKALRRFKALKDAIDQWRED
ncbi:PaRep2b protein [Pyrobaculum aerophilum]|uniref:PaRep2b protein n=1 Tax=Pyrobaculum aerophilum TaxID=13773 RepID=UPI0026CB2B7C|nr:PaRep2b protein [Pyrobaculum aerophilum]